MKAIVSVLFVFIFSYSYTQSFIPMLEEDNIWSVDVYYALHPPCEPTPCQYTVTDQISLGDVEVIDGTEYFRIWSDGSATCLLREDNGVVFKYDEDDQRDRVLFDFTLEVSDTFLYQDSAYDLSLSSGCVNQVYGWSGEDLTVMAVDSVELAGVIRKVITFDQQGYFGNFQWIEGIGNITGFDFMWEQIDITDGSLLVCFETQGISYFFNNATSCDNTTLSIDDLDRDQIILYPNPITNTSILQFPSEGNVDLLKIYDVSGKLVKEEKVNKDYVLIDAMQYRSGLYFYQVFSENKLHKIEKFIIK
jgi:Secretion system C-terminal sorting domain